MQHGTYQNPSLAGMDPQLYNLLFPQQNPNQSRVDQYGDPIKKLDDSVVPKELSNLEIGALGINAFTSLAGVYSAFQQNKLLKKQFGVQKNLINRNIANSANTTNTQLSNQASLASQLTTGADFGSEAYKADFNKRFTPVDGSPIA